MEELGDNLLPFKEGDLVEANVLAVGGNRIWVDVAGQSLGFIPEREVTSKSGLKKGDKVKVTMIFRGREMAHVDLGRKILEKLSSDISGVGEIEEPPRMEGRFINMIVRAK